MFEQILETGSSRPLKGRSLGGGVAYIYIYTPSRTLKTIPSREQTQKMTRIARSCHTGPSRSLVSIIFRVTRDEVKKGQI